MSRLQNASFQTLFSSEATMQAQHYAKTKMDYLVFNGYNNLAVQPKAVIDDSEFQDAVVLGNIFTDTNGVSHRTVTVSVYKGEEAQPRAKLQQVFYSNDANKYVGNINSPSNSISFGYDTSNDKVYATVDGEKKAIGSSSGVPVGTIIAWPGSNAPTEGGTWLLCNGQSCTAYPALVAVVGNNVPNLNGRFLEGTTGNPRSFKDAGLLNITGTFELWKFNDWLSGAFYTVSSPGGAYSKDGGGDPAYQIGFDASKSNEIYGKSSTVQPASYTVRYYIKAA